MRTARLKTNGKFNFKYAHVEIRAKLPAGDWLWPALWMIPSASVYGSWPRSGEIDLLESRGNPELGAGAQDIGANQISATLNFGTQSKSAWRTAHFRKNLAAGVLWTDDFHLFQMSWTSGELGRNSLNWVLLIQYPTNIFAKDYVSFFVDDELLGEIPTGDGYFKRGNFSEPNIWADGEPDAPFDQEVY